MATGNPSAWAPGCSFPLNDWETNMAMVRLLAAFLAILLACGQSLARGNYHSEDRYNPQHISSLPPEVHDFIVHRCSEPKALHSFAQYFHHLKGVVLHFEHFLCDGDGAYCTVSSRCLHQVWISVKGHFRLMRSYYAPAGDWP
jgi:hypothetical protein